MYNKVDTNLNFMEREKNVEQFWRDNDIFKKSMEQRKQGPTYTFYDGPPTANGKPHIGHLETRVIKDMIPRYRTMKGYYVPRKAGWDTHGLPVELEVEKLLGLDGIVGIGGDGTFRGLVELSKQGVSVAGVPATIDNDIVCTEYTIGYDTAANTAVEAIDRLRDTMQSHERCSVAEVMGHNAGHLALYVGLATGATAVLVPEKGVDFERDVIDRIRQSRLAGNTHFMIIVAEGAGSGTEIGKGIHEVLGLDPRVTILGHIQRGGTPSARDRVMATRMGYHAVQALAEGKTNRVICAQAGKMVDIDILEGLSMKKGLNAQQYEVLEAMTGIGC